VPLDSKENKLILRRIFFAVYLASQSFRGKHTVFLAHGLYVLKKPFNQGEIYE